MKRALLFLLIVSACFLGASMPVHAEQRHMEAAIEMLQSAKQSDNPLPLLRAAKKHVANAKPNKGGERKQAAESINEAIAQATVGNKEKMTQKINAAIAAIHSGIAKGG